MNGRRSSEDKVAGSVTVDGGRAARRPRRVWLLAGALALPLSVWALYVFDAGSTPPTTRAVSSYGIDSRVCDSLPITTDALPEATGTHLIVVTEAGEVLRLDLGTGHLSCVRPVSLPQVNRPQWVWGSPEYMARTGSGTLLVSRLTDSGETWFVPDDPSLPAQELDEVGWSYLPGIAPDTVWEFSPGSPGAPTRLLNLITGRRSADLVLPSDGWVRVGDGAGQLVVRTRTNFRALAPDGTTAALWEGDDLLTVNAGKVLGRICDSATSCRLVTVDRRSGERIDLGPAPAELTLSNPTRLTDPAPLHGLIAYPGILSPDGTLLAAYGHDLDSSNRHILVFDLPTGETYQLATGTWPGRVSSWSDAGSMLFWVDKDRVLRLWRRDQPYESIAPATGSLPPVRGVALDD